MSTPKQPAAKGGRPRAAVPGTRATIWLRVPDYDRLLALAQRHEKSLSEEMRDLLTLKLRSGE